MAIAAGGPRISNIVNLLLQSAIAIILTLLTQIGGLVWLLAFAVRSLLPWRFRGGLLVAFLVLYIAASALTHMLAPLGGRVVLPCFADGNATLALQSPIYCVLNRNYMSPELASAAQTYADHMATTFPGTKTLALDANFPFIIGFPLLPHLSHDDGRKLDLVLYYRDSGGNFRNGQTRSPIGYFAFRQPGSDAPLPCAARRDRLTLRWNLDWLQTSFPDWRMEPERMREALRWLSTAGQRHGIGKIFIEPHIPTSLGISSANIRFQGCGAARHDDHIHIQLL